MPALRRPSPRLAAVATLALAAFVLLSVAVGAGWLDAFDRRVLGGVRERPPSTALFDVLQVLANVASPWVTALVVVALVALAATRPAHRPVVAVLVLALAGTAIVELALKLLLAHHGPTPESHTLTVVPVGLDNSYPSGHAVRALLLAAAAAALTAGPARTVAVIVAAPLVGLVLWSRLYLGEHWPSDVAGSVLLALATAPVVVGASANPRAGEPATPG